MKHHLTIKSMLACVFLSIGCLVVSPITANGNDDTDELFDFDSYEPVRYLAPVMSVDVERSRITVAEREIRLVNMVVRDREIKTKLVNGTGQPVMLGFFRTGQVVSVEGYLHPDGYVLATSIKKAGFSGKRVRADGYALDKDDKKNRAFRKRNHSRE